MRGKSPASSMSTHRTLGIATAFLISFGTPLGAQTASIGADVVSRYVWRGVDFGESMAVQPFVTIGVGAFEFGAWGSFSVSDSEANENDLWVTYTRELSNGASFSVGLTDYYFPTPGGEGFGDPHTIELSVAFSGPNSVPLSLFAGSISSEDATFYLEGGYAIAEMEGVALGVHAGFVTSSSEFYGTDNAALVNLGLTAAKDWAITETFNIPIGVAYIVNPDRNRAHLVFSLSIAP